MFFPCGCWADIFATANTLPYLVAYASTFGNWPRGARGSAGCERTAWRARHGGVAVAPASARHAHAPARDGSRATDRPCTARLRRLGSAGDRRWRAADDGAREPRAHLAVGHDPSGRPARR